MVKMKKIIGYMSLLLLTVSLFLYGCSTEKDSGQTVQKGKSSVSVSEPAEDPVQKEMIQEQSESVYPETTPTKAPVVYPEESQESSESEPTVIESEESEAFSEEDKAEIFVGQMSLEEKVAQMFVVTPDALTGVSGASQAGDITRSKYEEIPVGGFILMEGNIKAPEQLTALTSGLKDIAKQRMGLIPFLCVDEEGGTVTRIASNSGFSVQDVGRMSEIGATGDPQKAYEVGTVLGAYLSEYGLNVNFAPVADILLNSENSVVGSRSFGSDPELVASMVTNEIQGLHETNVATAVKHFPGHGYTEEDSHDGLAYSNRTLEEISSCELMPFQAGIEAGTEFVMVGHIAMPEITGNDTPASLSYDMVTEILRNQMDYQGLVITDAMNMGAISNLYSSADAAIQAVQAGCDVILMPLDFYSAYKGVVEAVRNGTILEERIDESVLRIVNTKLKMYE